MPLLPNGFPSNVQKTIKPSFYECHSAEAKEARGYKQKLLYADFQNI